MILNKNTTFLLLISMFSRLAFSADLEISSCGELETRHPLLDAKTPNFVEGLIQQPVFLANAAGEWFCPLCSSKKNLKDQTRRTRDRKNKPLLALSLEISKTARWADGQQVVGEDVAFTIKMALAIAREQKSAQAGFLNFWKKIDHIHVDPQNPRRFDLFFFALESDFYQFPNFYLLPSHIFTASKSEETDEELLAEVRRTYLEQYWTEKTNLGLFNGPYFPSLNTKNQQLLKRNPSTNLNTNSIQTITNLIEKKDKTVILAKESKNRLVCKGLSRTKTTDLLPKSQVELSFQTSIYEVLIANQRNPALANPMLRIPILEYATGAATPDPELLERKLRDLGWKKDLAKKFTNMGKELDLSLYVSSNPDRVHEAEVIRDRLKLSGVDLKIHILAQKNYQLEVIERPNFPSLAMMAWPMPPGDYLRSYFHSKEMPTFENQYSGQNYMGWQSPEIDKLFDQLLITFDPEKIKALQNEIDLKIKKDRPIIILFEYIETFIIPKGLTGLKAHYPMFPASLSAKSWALTGN